MRRMMLLIWVILVGACGLAQAQETATPTPTETATATPTPTPTAEPWVYGTLSPVDAGDGQIYRFDYTMTAGDVMIAFLLLVLLFSVWAFLIYEVVMGRRG